MFYYNNTSLDRASIPGVLQVSFAIIHSHTPMQSLVQEASIIAALWTGTYLEYYR